MLIEALARQFFRSRFDRTGQFEDQSPVGGREPVDRRLNLEGLGIGELKDAADFRGQFALIVGRSLRTDFGKQSLRETYQRRTVIPAIRALRHGIRFGFWNPVFHTGHFNALSGGFIPESEQGAVEVGQFPLVGGQRIVEPCPFPTEESHLPFSLADREGLPAEGQEDEGTAEQRGLGLGQIHEEKQCHTESGGGTTDRQAGCRCGRGESDRGRQGRLME